ncbi:LPXTG cell wall anchor domain-containing protein [Saccharothrix sp. NRRL B-16348]|uniref:LPXTG cell wall anchor domain-containing protein n=1 Tax=Saccharothrix sp. NRRL B-16348 TaxID=1415542 RepID=UPI0006AD9A20|nr:LPXTG cell wall anchor domain-containing protein [Saccharothrix sp. NRRL B-16348]
MVVLVCLALGLAVAPGVASADPPWHVPDGWADQVRGDVCKHRGDPPCHTPTTTTTCTTTTAPSTGGTSTGTSTGVTTTTTAVSGTSATSVTSTDVGGTTTATTTSTSNAGATTGATGAFVATVPAGAPPAPRVAVASANQALADTGAAPLWTGVGGLAVLLAGAVLLLLSRRRRA